MKELRVLFTGVGRRVELLQAFREAALSLNVGLKLFGVDSSYTAPALLYCDKTFKTCGMREDGYISELANICSTENIDILIPTIDTDLLVLSENVAAFGKTKVLISAPDKIKICRNKNYTADFFVSCGCRAPETFNDHEKYNGPFPCFIKPCDGSSSINAYKVDSRDKLKTYAEQIGEYIIQPFVDGVEYTVDIFCDLDGEPVYIVPRVRMQVRSGEVLKTRIDMDAKIIAECKRIIEKFHPIGPMTVQLIRRKDDGEDFYIEINPRYGGGAPLSMKAGAKSARALLQLLAGDAPDADISINNGAIFSRFDQCVCIDHGEGLPIKGVIFDLDDTLYSEKQYVRSGYTAIERFLGIDGAAKRLYHHFENGSPAIDAYLNEVGMTEKKDECLRIYREHTPEISLYDWVIPTIRQLTDKDIKVGIITDGRPSGQRKKLSALGLDDLVDDVIITDELGGVQFRKPCDIAFRIMQRKWGIPFGQLIYVGDNLQKDFHAPRQLGMQYRHIDNKDGIYRNK